jgi:DNA-binding SARP family transcriptional activator
MSELAISGFGVPSVTFQGREVHWQAASARTLFFSLLPSPDGRSREDLIRVLWPDSDEAGGGNRFRVALHRVRSALGAVSTVTEECDRYRLSTEVWAASDVARFQLAVRTAEHAPTGEARQAALRRAVDAYSGDFLPGDSSDWAVQAREEYKAAFVKATLELSMLHCAATECTLAVRHLAQALKADPLIGENYHQDLMSCLTSVESPYAAVEHYRRFLRLLRDGLEDTPMRETADLAMRIRDGLPICLHQIGTQVPCTRILERRTDPARPVTLGADADEAHQEVRRSRTLLGLANALQAATTLPEVVRLTLGALGSDLHLESLFIFQLRSGAHAVQPWTEPPLTSWNQAGRPLPDGFSWLCQRAVDTLEAQFGAGDSSPGGGGSGGPGVAAAVPVLVGAGEVVAVLAVSRSGEHGDWTSGEGELLTEAARTLGFTFHKAELRPARF